MIGVGVSIGAGSNAVSSTGVDITTTAAIPAGAACIARLVTDNSATTDGVTVTHLTATDSAGAVAWDKLLEYSNGEGAAGAGVTTSLWRRNRQASALALGSVITFTLSAAVVDKVAEGTYFPCDGDLLLQGAAVGNVLDAAVDFGSVAFSALPEREYLFVRGCGMEANVANTSQITPSAGFTALAAARSRNNAAAVLTRGEYLKATATGATSNPAFAFSGDSASAFVALYEAAALPTLHHEQPMLQTAYAVGAADQEVELRAINVATGLPDTSLNNASAGLTLVYRRLGADPVTASGGTIVAVTPTGAHADWGFGHVTAGIYRVCVPDAAGAAPNPGRYEVTAYGVSGVVFSSAVVEISGSDPRAAALTTAQIAVEVLLTLAYARGHRVYESGGNVIVTDTDGTTILSTQPITRAAAGALGAVTAGG